MSARVIHYYSLITPQEYSAHYRYNTYKCIQLKVQNINKHNNTEVKSKK